MEGRVALVCGASKGIGKATALRLAEMGADVAVAARSEDLGQAVADEIVGIGRRSVFIKTDVSNVDSAQAMVRTTVEKLGRVDAMVVSGSAGGGSVKAEPFIDIDPHSYPEYMTSQLITRLNAIGAALPAMRDQNYGKIVLVTSDAGRVPTTSESLFGVACAGLQFGVRAIGREVARFGIRINAVSITVTKGTGTWDGYLVGDAPGELLLKVFKRIEDKTPFDLNEPEDVAAAACFFASPASDQITGATLSVNGGLSFP
jgi:3-oxoacyl-[acyl-carrier protein] reductase